MFAGKVGTGLVLILALPLLSWAQEGATGPGSTEASRTGQPAASAPSKKSGAEPRKSVRGTIEQAIKALEAYDCVTFAVNFLSPIKRAQIEDLEAYKAKRQCSPQNRANTDEALLALKLARLAVPEYKGITATISFEGVGLRIQKFTLVKYLDGKWYFNEL